MEIGIIYIETTTREVIQMVKAYWVSLLMSIALVSVSGCSDESSDDPIVTFSCQVANGTDSYDLSYCQDYEIVESEKQSLQNQCTETQNGTLSAGSKCSVSSGTKGCVLSDAESGQAVTWWLDGSNWTDDSIASSGICSNATIITKA